MIYKGAIFMSHCVVYSRHRLDDSGMGTD